MTEQRVPDMTFRVLGRTGLSVSRVGLGAGGPSRLGMSRKGDTASVERLVCLAVDLGINLIDTARAYGTEEALGKALRSVKEQVYVATKVKCYATPDVTDPHQDPIVDPGSIITSVEESLQALQRDTIDILQLHAVAAPGLEPTIEHLVPAMIKLREQGKVRFLGITEHPGIDPRQEMAAGACESGVFDTLMLQYSIFDQQAEQRTFALARQHDVGLFCMCAARGACTSPAALRQVLALCAPEEDASLDFLLEGPVASYADAAFRFAAARVELDCVLVGTSEPDHLLESAAAILGDPLPAVHVETLKRRFGHLDGALLWPEYALPR